MWVLFEHFLLLFFFKQIEFDKDQTNAYASVVLPPSLLKNLSQDEFEVISRAQFTFFNKNGLFQVNFKVLEVISVRMTQRQLLKVLVYSIS